MQIFFTPASRLRAPWSVISIGQSSNFGLPHGYVGAAVIV
jgi:hypothetical protein